MKLILLIVVIYLIYKFFIKENDDSKEVEVNIPAGTSRSGKKAIKEFQNELRVASGEYGEYAINSMEKVAEAYALGNGVEKDAEKAKYWKERQIRAKLQQKTYINEFMGPAGYTAEGCLDFFTDGKLVPADLDKAEELAWLLCRTGCEKSAGMLKKILKQKYPERSGNLDINRVISDYPTVCIAKHDRSKKKYAEFCEEMKTAGVSDQMAVIDWLLKKAEWNVEVKSVAFPGAAAELEKQFKEARAIEAKGQDFKQAIAAYEPLAQAGHSEAMRRLGLIQRDITSENACTVEYASGQSWIEKAAQTGNALAAYDLGGREVDVAFVAGLAGQGYLDALYALGCMVEKGQGGKANWDVAQAIFRNMEQLIGNPIAAKNGEGIEWLRKLGEKFSIIDDDYYIKLADAGSAIGYGPSQTEHIYMSHEMMRRAYEKSNDKAGEYGDFGYCSYIIKLSQEPQKAGIARAKKIAENCKKEQYNYSDWKEKKLKEAEAGTGIWQYNRDKFSPKERMARAIASMHRDLKALYFTRCQRGMNFYKISDKILESENYDASVEEAMKMLPKEARSTYGAETSKKRDSEFNWDPVKEHKENMSFKNMPSYIYDGGNNRWDKLYAYDTCAVYKNDDFGEATITYCDIESKKASGYGIDFHWW